MKKYKILVIALCSLTLYANCQLSEGGLPESFQQLQLKTAKTINSITLDKLNTKLLNRQDSKTPEPYRYSIKPQVNIDFYSNGTITKVDQGTIWQYELIAKDALGLAIVFSYFELPDGAKLFVYSKDKAHILGAFTSKNNKPYKTFAISDLYSTHIVIEYYEPKIVPFHGTIILGKVGQIYRNPDLVSFEAGPDRIDINCPTGDKVQLEKHSVAKMTYEKNGSGYLCTGALINNAKNDGTPYFLTANHCISNNTVANTLVTYFNYEKTDCNGSLSLGKSLSGATYKAGYDQFDFTLLLLDETPGPEYKPYFAGWNAQSDSMVLSGTGIHHPSGVEKKVSVDIDPIPSYPFGINWEGFVTTPPHAHWFVDFDHGQTEGGSSGSPLFDQNKRIIGQLSGGGETESYYGKLSRSWNDGNFSFQRLKPWLDPENEGILILDGYYPPTNKPEAIPNIEYEDVCLDGPVQLLDNSLFEPDAWKWSFTPASVKFIEGTNETTQNPIVQFTESTSYDIKLEVKKGLASHSRTKKQLVSASNEIRTSILNLPKEVCLKNLNNIDFIAKGASKYSWKIDFLNEAIIVDSSSLFNDTLLIEINPAANIDSSFTIQFSLVGTSADCADTLKSALQIINLKNDSIKYAYNLSLGKNGPYTNSCATKEDNEPNPISGDCNSQSSWCECDTFSSLIENSLWFTFIAPESGIVGINAPGFDNQIAIYEADSESDILSNASDRYKIIAANDDYFGEEQSFHALIDSAKVIPGKKYWVQVDGSACGTIGEFYLYLFDKGIDESVYHSNNIITQSRLELFPNPASDYLILPGMQEDFYRADFKLINLSGKEIISVSIDISVENTINLPLDISEGLYIGFLNGKEKQYTTKVSIIK